MKGCDIINNEDKSDRYLDGQSPPAIAAISLVGGTSSYNTSTGFGSEIVIPPALVYSEGDEEQNIGE